jgi:hypothetical protein
MLLWMHRFCINITAMVYRRGKYGWFLFRVFGIVVV